MLRKLLASGVLLLAMGSMAMTDDEELYSRQLRGRLIQGSLTNP